MGPHHILKSIVGTSRDVTSWVQPGAILLPEFSELQGSRYCRPPSPRAWPWKVLSQLSRMKRPISLPAIPSDTRRMVVGLYAHSRGIPDGLTCSGHVIVLRGDTE